MFTPIDGRTVLVTGGTKGIGKGIAGVFARAGANVVVTGRDAEQGEAAARELSGQGGEVAYVGGDVAKAADCERVAAETAARFGGIDVVCANAGVFPDVKLADMTEEDIDSIFATNVKGCMLTVKACVPHLERTGRGRVILTSSITGPVTGYPGWSHYGATKAAQLGFIRTACIELAPKGHHGQRRHAWKHLLGGARRARRGLSHLDDRLDPTRPPRQGGGDRRRGALPRHGRGRVHHGADHHRGRRPGRPRVPGRAAVGVT